jgi:hypothetical protein
MTESWAVWLQAADIDALIADEEDEFEPAAAFVERHAPVPGSPKRSTKTQRKQQSTRGQQPSVGDM